MDYLYPILQKTLETKGVSIESLAVIAGCGEKQVQLKLMGVLEWSLTEAVEICRYLQYPDIKTLFLRKLR